MPVRIYVRGESVRRLEEALSQRTALDGTGLYFQLDLDPTHPASSTGDRFAPGDVLGATWKETVYAGFRPDGYYEIEDAYLSIKTGVGGTSQTFSASGKDYKTMQELVLKVRTGELQPKLDFTAKTKVDLEPIVIQTDTRMMVGSQDVLNAGIKLRELLENAHLSKMQDISHSMVKVEHYWCITVAGLVPKIKGPDFD